MRAPYVTNCLINYNFDRLCGEEGVRLDTRRGNGVVYINGQIEFLLTS